MPLLLVGAGEFLVLFSSVYVAAIFLYGDIHACELAIGPLLPRSILIAVVILVSLVAMGLYQFRQRLYFHEAVVRVLVGFVMGSLVIAALFYAFPSLKLSREFMAVSLQYAIVLVLAIRYWFLSTVDEKIFSYRTLVFGAGNRANSIGDLRRKADRRGFRILGSVPAPGDSIKTSINGPIYEDEDILDLARRLSADEIVVAFDERRGNLPIRDLLACKLSGIEVIDLLEFLERESGKIRVDLVNPGWLIFSQGFRVSKLQRAVVRIFDFTISLFALLMIWPIMLLVAMATKLEDGIGASVFYRQERVGYHGQNFDVLKFRSMHVDAESDGEEQWAVQNDQRITRVGKTLRRYRLDELPQIINVLRGDMSLVGPRPERPKFVARLAESIPYYMERHTVKPGITGWAQLNYSYGATEQDALEKLQFDLYYVKNQSLFLDLAILLQTIEVVLWGKGAR